MPRPYTTSFHAPAAALAHAAAVGAAAALLRASPRHAGMPLAQAMQRLLPPLALRQYRLRHDAQGRPQALVTWAWFADELISQRPPRPLQALHRSEWNEGAACCICDVLGDGDAPAAALADLLAGELSGQRRLHAYPRGAGGAFGHWEQDHLPQLSAWFAA